MIDHIASPEAAKTKTEDMTAERSAAMRTDEVRSAHGHPEVDGHRARHRDGSRLVARARTANRRRSIRSTEMRANLTPDQVALAELAAEARKGANTTGAPITEQTHAALQELAAGVGLPPAVVDSMPPEMRLLVAGFSPDEIAQHFTARDVDADVIRDPSHRNATPRRAARPAQKSCRRPAA
jgi:hypothetical protein